MKINIFYLTIILLINILFSTLSFGDNQFNFNISEIEIIDNGNIIKGTKKGIATTNDGLSIEADEFIFFKNTNTLKAYGNVKFLDPKKKSEIFADKLIYIKNKEIISAEGSVKIFDFNKKINIFADNVVFDQINNIIKSNKNSKAIYDEINTIYADSFNYDKNANILKALGRVKAKNEILGYSIFAKELSYLRNEKKIISKGETTALLENGYKIESKDISYLINDNSLSSNFKTKIYDKKSNVYSLDKFKYFLNNKVLKGENILIITNYDLPKSDKLFFSSAIIDLKNQEFVGKDTKINIHKNVFDNSENDPRLIGVSSSGDEENTIINKGIFTSCKENGDCPPWSIQASKIEHDKIKKQISYENAVLKIYNLPVLYFPKFFHPDPSVKRQSGLLKPKLNNSNILGSSVSLPYYKVISENKDITFEPTFFDSDVTLYQSEYRQLNKNSKLISDFGFVKNYKSNTTKKTKNLSHLFVKYDLDLELSSFNSSDLAINIERVSSDMYPKIFTSYLTKSEVRPKNLDTLNNNVKLFLDHNDYYFESGFQTFEKLKTKNSDRYQFILPYYNFNKTVSQNYFEGSLNLYSNGSNDLNETNSLKTSIINDLNYNSNDFVSKLGLKSNYNFNIKNLNSLGKKTSNYKSSPQVELISLFNFNVSLPLLKNAEKYTNLITPKINFKLNPSDMKDSSSSDNLVNVNNVFSPNRLGLSDTFEAGRSLTVGLDFKKEYKSNKVENLEKYFEFKLATVFRDKEENFISNKSTLNRKNSNLFGSIENKVSNYIKFGYNFSVDNDYSSFEYNDFNATFSLNNIVTGFSFIEENGEIGDTNNLSSYVDYKIDDNNILSFKTRRNRKINLTEYYDLVYEYKNDCLTAGIKYNKTYYSDGDLKPSENLLFTITLVPITSYEYKADELLEN